MNLRYTAVCIALISFTVFTGSSQRVSAQSSKLELMASCLDLTSNLKSGDKDSTTSGDVSRLQQFLFGRGYLNTFPTGYFGSLTTTAVKAYQKEKMLPRVGVVGPATRLKISKDSCTSVVEEKLPASQIGSIVPVQEHSPVSKTSSSISGQKDTKEPSPELIKNLAAKLPFYSNLRTDTSYFVNKGYLDKEYTAAVLYVVFNSLPDKVYNKTAMDFIYSLSLNHVQMTNLQNILGHFPQPLFDMKTIENVADKVVVCPSFVHCADGQDRILSLSDLSVILHEYGHYVDGANSYKNSKKYLQYPNSNGVISSALDFYAISYRITDQYLSPLTQGHDPYLPLREGVNTQKDFVSQYALGLSYTNDINRLAPQEDFAESFSFYVLNGRGFRKLTERSAILKAKYEWLKANVFEGKEYVTGSDIIPDSLPYTTNDYYRSPFAFELFSGTLTK